MTESFPKDLKLSDVIETNRMNQQLLMGEIDPYSAGFRHMTEQIFNVMHTSLEGFRGGFGLGFPYHSMNEENKTIGNPEFARYTSLLTDRLETEVASGVGWPCVECQSKADFIPAHCKTCSQTNLKPRDVMKALPDIDTFIVMEETTPEVLSSVWQLAQKSGFTQSDFSIVDSVLRVNNVLEAFEFGKEPNVFLPVDLHVMSKQNFLSACNEIGAGETNLTTEIWSMYADWKLNTNMDFWFDFIFSVTPYPETMDDEVYQAVTNARERLTRKLENDAILEAVMTKSNRAGVLLGNKATAQAFHMRVDGWRN